MNGMITTVLGLSLMTATSNWATSLLTDEGPAAIHDAESPMAEVPNTSEVAQTKEKARRDIKRKAAQGNRQIRKVEPKVNPKVNPRVNPKVNPKVDPKVNPKVDPEISPKVEPKINPEVEPKITEPRVKPRVEPKVDPRQPGRERGPNVNRDAPEPRVPGNRQRRPDVAKPKGPADRPAENVRPGAEADVDARARANERRSSARANADVEAGAVPRIDLNPEERRVNRQPNALPGVERQADRTAENRRRVRRSLNDRREALRNRLRDVDNDRFRGQVLFGQSAYWPTWYDNNFGYHDHWYHGHRVSRHWSPRRYASWWWQRYPVLTLFGVTDYTLGYTGYAFGYRPYYNPFYVSRPGSVYDYSRSIAYYVEPTPQPIVDGTDAGLQKFAEARDLFMQQDYEGSLIATDAAIELRPRDIEIHQFRSQVQFALGNYDESAAGLHAVLSLAPSWNWETLRGLYPSVDVYTQQLRRLEDHRIATPDDLAARFLLGNFYNIMGYPDDAADEWRIVAEAKPDDVTVANLLSQVDPNYVPETAANAVEPPEVGATVEAEALVGEWNATRDDGRQYDLALKPDGSFAWNFSGDEAESHVQGAYALKPNGVLAMELDDGAVMFAQVVPNKEGFDLHMIGDSTGQPPLRFTH